MGETLSGCGSWPGSFVGGRRRADIDDIGLAAIPVGSGLRDEWRAVSVVWRPLSLLPRGTPLYPFDSHCAGTLSAACSRCIGAYQSTTFIDLAGLADGGLNGGLYGSFWLCLVVQSSFLWF